MNNLNNNPKIKAIYDYIVKVYGPYTYKQNQVFKLKSNEKIKFFLISASTDEAYLLTNTNNYPLNIDEELIEVAQENLIKTDTNYYGKIINIYGDIIWPKNTTDTHQTILPNESPVFGRAHNLMTVKPLNQQLYTGIISIDLLIPIGKGQRELIIGDRRTGKTHLAINAIINQSKDNVKCIYVAIGQKRETITNIYNVLKEYDALKNTIIIDASSNAYEQYLAPYIGMAHAENISYNDDVLIIFDDLSKHSNIFREIALLTDKPVGKEAMPSDMFFAHSSLLERAGSFVNKKTITALPIIQTIDGDITSLIASNDISITDGQIVTNTDLFTAGKLPAINIDLSVSRTGSSVQSATLTKVAGEIGKIYKKYKQHLKLAALDYELNKETASLLRKGKMIDKMFTQKGYSLYSYNFVLFMTKLISWDILKGVNDSQKALAFLDILINTQADAINAFKTIKNGDLYDDKLMKDFFAFALHQYSTYTNLNWEIDYNHSFIPFTDSTLLEIAKKLGDK
ncbi:MSC_0619 family F1-like ATPase alpha subunit [Mycoplasmopsis primatum]|uniref:MSC_0619 family F1-like ATPase alpha subunit n=1 Tax=Mycoplasmopsis primatum TaxID=55604 RepID=UPI000497AE2E|nr:ATP F0F1 synthase subunit alpha [Mycoplasmopsis primatum]